MQLYVNSIGFAAPGMPTWQEARPVLAGEEVYQFAELDKYKPGSLPPNERRRATQLVRLAFRAAENAVEHSTMAVENLATVFSSSGGDYPIIDQICTALAKEDRAVSPTQFHNSVHNSAAGYWSIAVGSTQPSNSLSAYDYSFSQGMIEAAGMVLVDGLDTLLAVYDICPPTRLQKKREIMQDFGMALVLSKDKSDGSVELNLELLDEGTQTEVALSDLSALYHTNPAARSLPLLELMAKKTAGDCYFDLPSGLCLKVGVNPCC